MIAAPTTILLPINQTLLNDHAADCWAFYCYLYKSVTRTYCNFSPTSITINLTLDAGKSMSGRLFAGLGPSVWNKYKHEWPRDKLLIVDEPTTMLRLDVFEKAHSKILPLAARSRTGYLRCFLYMYFMCHKHNNDFGISINRLAAELGSNTNDICTKIKFFIDAGLLRRMGKYNADLGMTYRYFIPLEEISPF